MIVGPPATIICSPLPCIRIFILVLLNPADYPGRIVIRFWTHRIASSGPYVHTYRYTQCARMIENVHRRSVVHRQAHCFNQNVFIHYVWHRVKHHRLICTRLLLCLDEKIQKQKENVWYVVFLCFWAREGNIKSKVPRQKRRVDFSKTLQYYF